MFDDGRTCHPCACKMFDDGRTCHPCACKMFDDGRTCHPCACKMFDDGRTCHPAKFSSTVFIQNTEIPRKFMWGLVAKSRGTPLQARKSPDPAQYRVITYLLRLMSRDAIFAG